MKKGDIVRAIKPYPGVYCTQGDGFDLEPGTLAVVRNVIRTPDSADLVDFAGRMHTWGRPLQYWEVVNPVNREEAEHDTKTR